MRTLTHRLVWTLWIVATPAIAQEEDDKYRHDFRGSRFPSSVFQRIGKNASKHVRPSSEGLRVFLPEGKGPFPQLGFTPKFKITGDFEITVAYTILKADSPKTGYGNGISLIVKTESEEDETATLGVLVDSAGKWRIAANRATGPKGGRQHMTKDVPTGESVRSGYLRLRRKGSVVQYSISTNKGQQFTQLREVELGDEPVARLRIVADSGGSLAGLDVVFRDVVIRADNLTTGSEELEKSSSWGLWAIVGVIAFVLGIGGFEWYRRRGRQEEDEDEE